MKYGKSSCQATANHVHWTPIPTKLLKTCINCLLPSVTKIINTSIETSLFPPQFKTASVAPVLKKPTLDKDELSNYRPVSNLPYLGKITEKVVVKQLKEYLKDHDLNQPLQSAYREFHSTETAIVKIMNDILISLDKDQCILLIMLDLSAAFDTVDHTKLLSRFESSFGIQSDVKAWLHSYFTCRHQVVKINGTNSDPQDLKTGMPQGSVLGPFCFPLYTSPLFKIAEKHKCGIHMYADDTQLYMPCTAEDSEGAVSKMENCITDVKKWMSCNFLKLNGSKTEFLVISKRSQKEEVKHVNTIKIGDSSVNVACKAKNIGCIIDSTVTMEDQVNSVTKGCYERIHEIGRIRHNLTKDAAATLINSQVTSKLDSFNAVLTGLSTPLLNKLQKVQNSAARLLTGTKKYDHITPVLKKLHWLPVKSRIDYKILLLCFKALHDLAPKYLCDMIRKKKPGQELRPSSIRELEVPPSKTKTYGDRAFSYIAPTLWNSLPSNIRKIDKLQTFKSKLKTHLFEKAYKSM